MFSVSYEDFGYTFQGVARPADRATAYAVAYRMHDAPAVSGGDRPSLLIRRPLDFSSRCERAAAAPSQSDSSRCRDTVRLTAAGSS